MTIVSSWNEKNGPTMQDGERAEVPPQMINQDCSLRGLLRRSTGNAIYRALQTQINKI